MPFNISAYIQGHLEKGKGDQTKVNFDKAKVPLAVRALVRWDILLYLLVEQWNLRKSGCVEGFRVFGNSTSE